MSAMLMHGFFLCVYDDRIEVTSPGMLYGRLDMQSAKSGKSKCRNTAIAESFRYMGLIEAWGTGIPRMIKECREYGLREPMFEELGDSIRVTIFRENEELKRGKGAEYFWKVKDGYLYNTKQDCNSQSNNESESDMRVSTMVDDDKKHCLEKEKALFDEAKVVEVEKNHCLNKTKPLFQDENQSKNHCFNEKLVVINNKNLIYKKLEELQTNKMISNVTALNIKIVIESFSGEEVFGRKEIKERLGYKDSKAGFLIEKMQEFELIKAVRGQGKGKYCFDI